MRAFVRGDVDGFFGLALDNLVQVLLIDSLCRHVLGFPAELVYGRILPAVAVSLVVGNVYYARQALRLARATGRTDVCALPYGINTVSLFAYVFLVMLPAKLAAKAAAVRHGHGSRLVGTMETLLRYQRRRDGSVPAAARLAGRFRPPAPAPR